MMELKEILDWLVSGNSLSVEQAVDAFEQIMSGEVTPSQIGAMLALIQQRGPTDEELLGAARLMRSQCWRVNVPEGLIVIDTCGTGGDHTQTFNISTAAAIVAAGAGREHGIAIAKHGNRAVTSKSGSSDALAALGVKVKVAGSTLTQCLEHAGLCFCFAPAHHPAMKHVAQVRQELGFRTLFNLVGPLTNPAGAQRQVVGVFSPDLTEQLVRVLQGLEAKHVMVVHGRLYEQMGGGGAGGLDELTTSGVNRISQLRDGQIQTYEVDPAELGLAIGHPAALRAHNPESSAGIIRTVLEGEHGPARDIVCLNAAAALVVADVVEDLADGLKLAAEAIDSKAAAKVLAQLVRYTQADPTPIP